MFNILTLNKIAKCGLDQLNDNYKITDDANVDADGIISYFIIIIKLVKTSLMIIIK